MGGSADTKMLPVSVDSRSGRTKKLPGLPLRRRLGGSGDAKMLPVSFVSRGGGAKKLLVLLLRRRLGGSKTLRSYLCLRFPGGCAKKLPVHLLRIRILNKPDKQQGRVDNVKSLFHVETFLSGWAVLGVMGVFADA